MTEAQFLAGITGRTDDLRTAIHGLSGCGQLFCLGGGLAVSHYAEPMVTLDAEFAVRSIHGVEAALLKLGFHARQRDGFLHASLPGSRLRVSVTDSHFHNHFPERAISGLVFGVPVPVACLSDLVKWKLHSLGEAFRTVVQKQMDIVGILRLAESQPSVFGMVPPGQIPVLDELRAKF